MSGVFYLAETMKRNFHVPRNIRCAILSFFLLFRIIGLATFSIRNVTWKQKNLESTISFTRARSAIIYNLLLSCLLIVSNYITVPQVASKVYKQKSDITNAIEISLAILGTLVISAILLCYCLNQSSLRRIGNSLINLQEPLRQLRHPRKEQHTLLVPVIAYFLAGAMFFGILYSDILAFQSGPLSWITDIVPATFISFFYLQYFSVLSLVDGNFASVNSAIQNLCRRRSGDTRSATLFQTRRVFIGTSQIQSLHRLRDLHDRLCDISAEISGFYALPTLYGLSFSFIALLYNAYYILCPVFDPSIPMDIATYANTGLWIVLILYPLGLLTSKVTNVKDEIERTGSFVHVLLNCAIDKETKSELKEFSLQLLHRRVKFTVNGYFSLDNTFFHSMLSAVTTYLVILVQFQTGTSSSNVCQCNCTQEL